jgi:5'-nucleotidase
VSAAVRTHKVRVGAVAAIAALALALAACGDDGGGSDSTTTTTTPTTALTVETLDILVTNDDGYAAEGIDALVQGLLELPDVEVTVSAPAEDQSGSGDTTTPGPLVADEAETASGHPALAVAGEPADSVLYALDEVYDEPPDLVVSGINTGQNAGPFVELSGTVGAALVASRAGIPAIAVSQGVGVPVDADLDYTSGVEAAVVWVTENRDALESDTGEIVNINVPTCLEGSIRGIVEVPLAATGEGGLDPSDCTSTLENPANDIEALLNGYTTYTVVDADDPVSGN